MGTKKSVYVGPSDLGRLKRLRGSLEAKFPAHRVTDSWVFRYALFRLFVEMGFSPDDAVEEEVRQDGQA